MYDSSISVLLIAVNDLRAKLAINGHAEGKHRMGHEL